jgi:hypothetical protein
LFLPAGKVYNFLRPVVLKKPAMAYVEKASLLGISVLVIVNVRVVGLYVEDFC